jgi:glycine/D-amino acid oxidase-like deaminating enzyme
MTRIAVIGAGAFGGWIALQLRRRGADVVLVDAYGPGNSRSSSGGETRVIRAVYGRDRIYVELVKRAYELWDELQATSGEQLYV